MRVEPVAKGYRNRDCIGCRYLIGCKGKPTRDTLCNLYAPRHPENTGAAFKAVLDEELRK